MRVTNKIQFLKIRELWRARNAADLTARATRATPAGLAPFRFSISTNYTALALVVIALGCLGRSFSIGSSCVTSVDIPSDLCPLLLGNGRQLSLELLIDDFPQRGCLGLFYFDL